MLKNLLDLNLSKEKFQEKIDEMHTHDIAISLMELSSDEQTVLLNYLTFEQIADIISYLEPEDAAIVLESFEVLKQKSILDEMTLDDAVDTLQAYSDLDQRESLIEILEDSEDIKEFIKYKENHVGAYMNNEFVVINPEMDVKDAVRSLIKQAPEAETINTLFVVDDFNKFLGAVNLKKLVKARSPKLIKDIMTTVPTVKDDSFIGEAIYDMKNYEAFELPVVDKEGLLIGILTLDDALDIALEEAEDDFMQFAALPARDMTRSIFKTALHRIPWLIALMIFSIPLITFTDVIAEAVAGIAILVFFQPLMLDSPGNVSTQTLAIALKSISNEGKMQRDDVIKELASGLYTGIILGVIAFLISFLFVYLNKSLVVAYPSFTKIKLALTFASILGGSLVLVVAVSPLLAILIPHTLKLFKVDPAVASGPFITTIIDLFAALVYFGLATIILRGVGLI